MDTDRIRSRREFSSGSHFATKSKHWISSSMGGLDQTIPSVFELRARETPDALAVVFMDQSISYRDLDLRSNHLSRRLRSRGIQAEKLVGICLERSIEMIVAILAVVKAGGAYVPLDPVFPEKPLNQIIRDGALHTIITQQHHAERFASFPDAPLCIDDEWDAAGKQTEISEVRELALTSRNLAYVIYTSGSSGKPKGVMVDHGNVINLWHSLEQAIYSDLPGCFRIGMNAPFTFDSSVKQIIQLLSGRTLYIIPQTARSNAAALLELLEEIKLDCLDCTPTQLKPLIDAGLLTNPASPRFMLIGGEPIDGRLWRLLADCHRPTFYNVYGPTECTVDATVVRIMDSPDDPVIGHALDKVNVHVLNECGDAVRIGEVGEIHISGAGVSRGYLNRADLTAENFIPDRHSTHGGSRTYKAGDMGRMRYDGALEYLGRNDQQVKVRGHRIELGEVESTIREHRGIKNAAVVLNDDGRGSHELIAYVVAGIDRMESSDELRRLLRADIVNLWMEKYNAHYSDIERSLQAEVCAATHGEWAEVDDYETISASSVLESLRNFQPKEVLEIGCGSGSLMTMLSPSCKRYHAVDISAAAIALAKKRAARIIGNSSVTYSVCSASELDSPPPETYDTIVLNSVVQCFPDVGYLDNILRLAIGRLSNGGRIFLGEIRHRGLHKVRCTAAQVRSACDTDSIGKLRYSIARAIDQEQELVVDPGYFEGLPKRFSRIASVQISIRPHHREPQLLRYTYDVILKCDTLRNVTAVKIIDWHSIASIASIETLLSQPPLAFLIRGVPNAELAHDVSVSRLVDAADEYTTVEDIGAVLSKTSLEGIEPEALIDLCETHGYHASCRFSIGHSDGRFDVLCRAHRAARVEESEYLIAQPDPHLQTDDMSEGLTNDPLANRARNDIVLDLREYLRTNLPLYMQPASIVLLREMPVSSNGKLDRRALPTVRISRSFRQYEAPQGAIEEQIADIWQKVLNVDRIGRNDDFLELGGHSVLSMQLLTLLGDAFGIPLASGPVIQCTTIREMANAVVNILSIGPTLSHGEQSSKEEWLL